MYIQPNTNIRILKNVPLDNTYEHTIYFNSRDEQQNYFIGLQKYNLTNYTYQRVKRGTARVGIKSDDLYDCNYMMFQNTSFGNKWFYAFITSVEYVNNDCSEISFEIDVMQTWHFDYSPDYCFVEREHSVTDIIGENITPESVETGEYIYNNFQPLVAGLDNLAIIVMIGTGDSLDGNLNEGVYGGCNYGAFPSNNYGGLNALLKVFFQDKPDSVVAIYMCPIISLQEHGIELISGSTDFKWIDIASEQCGYRIVHTPKTTTNDTLDGYKPKNNKLYTYPYNFLQVCTTSSSASYRYEFFKGGDPTFQVDLPYTMPVQVALRPKFYKGSGDTRLITEGLIIDGYPMCSWNTDAYKAWLAQNATSLTLNGIGNGINIGAGIATGNPNAVAGGVYAIGSSLISAYEHSVNNNMTKGNINSANVDISSKAKNFYWGRCSITSEYARIIDNYFTRFGYATKLVKIPNRNSRRHWNYVKTIDATITGSVPADDMKKICSIYDNGITFWKRGNEIGMYNLDNTVHS